MDSTKKRAHCARAAAFTAMFFGVACLADAAEPNLAKRFWSKVRPVNRPNDETLRPTARVKSESGGKSRIVETPPVEDEAPSNFDVVPAATETPISNVELGVEQEGNFPVDYEVQLNALSLAQLEQLAIQNNPSAREAAALIDKANGQAIQAKLYPNPVVGYQGSEIGNDGRAGQQGVFVGQEFVRGNKLGLAQDVAANDAQRLSWQYQVQLQRILTDVRTRYFQSLGAQREVDMATQLQQIAKESVDSVEKRRKDAGEGTESDVLQLELDLNQIVITKQNAERKLAAARRRLSYVIGQPDDAGSIGVVGQLEGVSAARAFETEWNRLTQSPLLQAAAWRVSRANALVRKEQAQPIPNVEVQAGVQYDYSSNDTIAGLQVGMPLPIHNRNQGNISSAFAELRQAREAQQRLELKLRDDLADALQTYETSLFQEEQYRKVVVPKSERNLKLTTEGWNVGEIRDDGFLKLVIARRSYYEAKLSHIRALTELRVAEARLDGLLLSGGLDAPEE